MAAPSPLSCPLWPSRWQWSPEDRDDTHHVVDQRTASPGKQSLRPPTPVEAPAGIRRRTDSSRTGPLLSCPPMQAAGDDRAPAEYRKSRRLLLLVRQMAGALIPEGSLLRMPVPLVCRFPRVSAAGPTGNPYEGPSAEGRPRFPWGWEKLDHSAVRSGSMQSRNHYVVKERQECPGGRRRDSLTG